jgi:hypothetical protein
MIGFPLTLTTAECAFAESIGRRRDRNARGRGATPRWGQADGDTPEHHRNGAAGEFAFAISLGRGAEWPEESPEAGPQPTDFAGCEVRTRSRDWYELTAHPESGDDVPHILVTGQRPAFIVRGWLPGRDCKLGEYWHEYVTGRPCYFVPQRVLLPFECRLTPDTPRDVWNEWPE